MYLNMSVLKSANLAQGEKPKFLLKFKADSKESSPCFRFHHDLLAPKDFPSESGAPTRWR